MTSRALQRALLISSLLASAASAQAPSGPAHDGLPGAHRVGSAHLGDRARLALIGWGGYGWIPGRTGEGGDHHRAFGSGSIAIVPVEFVALSAGAGGYWDTHPDDEDGADSSGVGAFYVALRGAVPLGALAIGADVRWDLNGGDAPDVNVEASRVSARALVSLWPEGWDLGIDLAVGYRFDGTMQSLQDIAELRRGDLVSLGVSSVPHSVLLGLGATVRFAPAELFLEGSFEPYVGDDVPPLTASPLRGAIGARVELTSELRAHLALEVSAHRRLRSDIEAPWRLPSEPRVAVMLALSFRPALDAEPAPIAEEEEEPEVAPPPPIEEEPEAPEPRGELAVTGVVNGPDGTPIAGARVELVREETSIAETQTGEDGRYRFEHVARGPLRLRITAGGFDERVRDLEVPEEGAAIEAGTETLGAAVRAGALRGLVRDFRGQPLTAEIVVSPGEHRAETDEAGTFELELPPGDYEVEIRARRFRAQRRQITIEENGVVILNVDLRRAR